MILPRTAMDKDKTKSKTERSNERRAIKDWLESERPREKCVWKETAGESETVEFKKSTLSLEWTL